MTSGAILRVFCADGPCQGAQLLDLDTGRVLFSDALDAEYCIYRIDLAETTANLAGSFPTAYFDSFDAPRRPRTHPRG